MPRHEELDLPGTSAVTYAARDVDRRSAPRATQVRSLGQLLVADA